MRRRLPWLVCAAALSLVAAAAGSSAYSYPRFQPVSIAFFDRQHGLLAEDDWTCTAPRGCRGRILSTSDGGAHWRLVYTGARGILLFPLRGTADVFALTPARMLASRDRGLHWQAAPFPPTVVSFAGASVGWRLGAVTTIRRPPPLEETSDGGRTWKRRVDPCGGDYGLAVALSFATATRGWLVCATEAGGGLQGKEVWQTRDAGLHWRLDGRTHPIAPPEPAQQLGNLPGFGSPTGIDFLPDGHGWLLQDRGQTLATADGGRTWHALAVTRIDQVAGRSATLLDDRTGFLLLRGCTVRLARTDDGGGTWTTLARWNSPTECTP